MRGGEDYDDLCHTDFMRQIKDLSNLPAFIRCMKRFSTRLAQLCFDRLWRVSRSVGLGMLLLMPLAQAMDLRDWKERSFKGNTQYSRDGFGIRGETDGAASVLYRETTIDLTETPIIEWRWKISNTYGNAHDEQSKAGDDYPARLYAVVKTGFLPWQTLAINYVWSSNQPVGTHWKNAYTDKAVMVVLDSGDAEVNLWNSHRRNLIDDFKRFFDVEITEIDGYAIMVDGDNTGASATAWFDRIRFVAE